MSLITRVTLRVHGYLVGRFGFKERDFDFSGSTVVALLDQLKGLLGAEKAQVLFHGPGLSDLIYVLVNGKNIEQGQGLRTELGEGDVVSILPLMAGG